MKAISEIHIASEIDSIINTREVALQIRDQILESRCTHVELNFQDVEFISRSFADQMHKEKIGLADTDILIEIVNASSTIMDMFRAVSNTQNAVDRQREEIPIYKITNIDTLSDYLYSI